MQESFSIEFNGPIFDTHQISAAALAQSLLALDGLTRRIAAVQYGQDVSIDIKVSGGFRPGSFIIDLMTKVQEHPVLAGAGTLITILSGVIAFAKWALGKKVKPLDVKADENGNVRVKNEVGHISTFNQTIVNIYNNNRTLTQLSRFTQTLDADGAESISLIGADSSPIVQIEKQDRDFLRQDDELILTDNEAEVLLEIIGPMYNGSAKGWTFSDGENGSEFNAVVEDDKFLDDVKERKVQLLAGTTMLAIVRTVQKKAKRTRTEKYIVEVKEIYKPED